MRRFKTWRRLCARQDEGIRVDPTLKRLQLVPKTEQQVRRDVPRRLWIIARPAHGNAVWAYPLAIWRSEGAKGVLEHRPVVALEAGDEPLSAVMLGDEVRFLATVAVSVKIHVLKIGIDRPGKERRLHDVIRAMIKERTSAGLAAARAEGRVGGRRKKLDAAKRCEIAESVTSGRKSGAEMARLYGVSQPTVSRIVAAHRLERP